MTNASFDHYIGCSTKNTHTETTISLFVQWDNHLHDALVMMIADQLCSTTHLTVAALLSALYLQGAKESTRLMLKMLG
jgi:hypothetical protein